MRKPKVKSNLKLKVKIKTAIKPRIVKKQKPSIPPLIVGLGNLRPPSGSRKKRKLLGRGSSSGHGKTSTRGVKGQTSRTGHKFYLGFEGGQMPLIRKIPKHGFSNIGFKKTYQIVNIKDLAKVKHDTINPETLEQSGLIKHKNELIKILGDTEVNKALTVQAHAFSKQAKEMIEKAGGKAEFINV